MFLLTFRCKLQTALFSRKKLAGRTSQERKAGVSCKHRADPGNEAVVTLTLSDSNHTGMYIKRKVPQSAQPAFSLCMMCHSHCRFSLLLMSSPVSSPISSFSSIQGKNPQVYAYGLYQGVTSPLYFPLPLKQFLHFTLCFFIFYCSAISLPPSAKRRPSCHFYRITEWFGGW